MPQLVQVGRFINPQKRAGPAAAISQPSLASIQPNPLVVIADASRYRQHNSAPPYAQNGSKSNCYSYPQGFMNWVVAELGRCRFDVWEDHSVYANNNYQGGANLGGSNFGLDGRTFSWVEQWLPKIGNSTCDILVLSCNLGSINNEGDGSVTAYCDRLKGIIRSAWAYGIYVVLLNCAERGVNAGGIWVSGGNGRTHTHLINTEMASWCAANSVPVVDHHGTQINTGDADHNPKITYVRGDPTDTTPGVDGTHWSNLGGYGAAYDSGGAIETFNAILPAFAEPDPQRAGNLVPNNGAMTGTGGTANGKGTMPDSWTLDIANLTNANVAASIVTEAPVNTTRFGGTSRRKLKLTYSSAGSIVGNAREGVGATCSITTTVGTWLQVSATIETSASDGTWGGCQLSLAAANGEGVVTMAPTDAGGSQTAGLYATSILPVTQNALCVRYVSPWFKSTATSLTVRFNSAIKNGSDSPWVKLYDVRVASDADPQDTYRVNTTTPVFTSANSTSAPEEAAGTFQVSCSAPIAKYVLSGTDAALFSINQYGVLSWNALDYEVPTDADTNNQYVFTITATPVNIDKAQITQNFTLTITDVNDGFTDQFTYAETTTDLAACAGSLWTRLGTLNAIRTNSTGGRAQNNSAIATTYYFAPQQGDTYQQQVTGKIGDTSGKMSLMILMNADATKWLRAIESGTDWAISDQSGAIVTVSQSSDMYKAKAAFDSYTFRVYGTNLYVYQNTVLIKTVDLTSRLTGGALETCRFSGMRNAASGSGTMESFNNRTSPAVYAAGVGLRALTMTPLTGTAGTPYAGTMSNITAGSSVTLVSVKKSGVDQLGWIADGTAIRADGSQVAGTYVVIVQENYPGAVNDGRQTTFNVVLS